MTSETPIDAVPGKSEAEPAQGEESLRIAMLQQYINNTPMQQYEWNDHAPHQRPVQRQSTLHTFDHGARLRTALQKNCLPSREEVISTLLEVDSNVVHSSLAKAVTRTFGSLPRRPPSDVLTCEEILILFGHFFAERLSHRGKVERLDNDPITVAKLRTTSLKFEPWASRPSNCVRVYTYPHCLSNTPEHSKYLEETPPETRHMIRYFTEKWPVTLEVAKALHAGSQVPSMTQWRWIHDGRNIVSEDVTIMTLVRKGPTEKCPEKTRTVVKTERKLTGSICLFILDDLTDVFSISDLAQSASHLLDHMLYAGDRVADLKRFSELDSFFLPLVSQFNSARDNVACGPWNGSDSPFASVFHHLRCLSNVSSPKDPCSFDDGFKLSRVSRCFSTKSSVWIGEKRISIAVLARYHDLDKPNPGLKRYNGLLLVSPGSEDLEKRATAISNIMISPALVYVDGIFSPIFCFLTLYTAALDVWSTYWWSFVNGVESLLQDDDILSHSDLHGLSSGTTDVELYFDIIRLLRTAIRWVESTGSDFDAARASIMPPEQELSKDYYTMMKNFDIVREELRARTDPLTTKMERILHDVKTLRQDLQGAASLREISGANRVNEHMMFLAVLTTIYLPLNLVAAFCGNSVSIRFNQGKEVATLLSVGAALALLTYAFPYYVQPWILRRRRKGCRDCPGESQTDEEESPGRTKSRFQTTYELIQDSFSKLRHLATDSPVEKMQKRDQGSKGSSSEDRSTAETV